MDIEKVHPLSFEIQSFIQLSNKNTFIVISQSVQCHIIQLEQMATSLVEKSSCD